MASSRQIERQTTRCWHDMFGACAEQTASAIGTPTAFLLAILAVVVWAFWGPLAGFSDTWQLIINTGTTIITFLIVFLIQATQNRDTRILNLKLDELLRAIEGARDGFVALNELSEADLKQLAVDFKRLAQRSDTLLRDDQAERARKRRRHAKRRFRSNQEVKHGYGGN